MDTPASPPPEFTDDEHDAERQESIHFQNVVNAFDQYRAYSLSANSRRLRDFYALPLAHQALLDTLGGFSGGFRKKIDLVDERIEANARFLRSVVDYPEIFDEGSHRSLAPQENASDELTGGSERIVEDDEPGVPDRREPHPYDSLHDAHTRGYSHEGDSHGHGRRQHHDHGHGDGHGSDSGHTHDHGHDHSHGHDHDHSHSHSSRGGRRAIHPKQRVSDADMDKLRSTLKQFVRDWSAEGQVERDACYTPILDALDAHFSDIPEAERANFQVLVPGTGLARLPFEVIQRGYSCQGNEFSHFMLLSAYYILNRSNEVNQHTIYPFIHSFSNMRSSETLLRGFKIPDVLPSSLPAGPAFSLVAGDFEEIYGRLADDDEREPQQGKWDAVLTCFFIDTAKNIVNYLTIIHELLAPGGIWINLGPLLWHFENSNSPSDTSIELSLDEVQSLADKIGFDIKNERMVDATYVDIGGSMLSHVYHAAFWTATKKTVGGTTAESARGM